MIADKWAKRFLELADLVATWSKDPSTKVGCVLVDDSKVVATGFNGFPPGIADDARLRDRGAKYSFIVHAEMNAILQAGHEARGSSLFLSGFDSCPCSNCSKHLITAGVSRVVHRVGVAPPEHWADDLKLSERMLLEAGVLILKVPR